MLRTQDIAGNVASWSSFWAASCWGASFISDDGGDGDALCATRSLYNAYIGKPLHKAFLIDVMYSDKLALLGQQRIQNPGKAPGPVYFSM